MAHVFLRRIMANRTWFSYYSFAGMNIDGLSLIEVIMLWWGADVKKGIRS